MSLFTSIPFLKNRRRIPRQIISDSWADRDKILNNDVNLFCWKRPVNPEIQDFLAQLIDHQPAPISFRASVQNLRQQIDHTKQPWYLETFGDGFHAFWADIELLAGDFIAFSQTGQGTVHLKMVTDDACAKFHIDAYKLRLFTTYNGKGTEWIPEIVTNRRSLGRTNDLIVKDPSQIQRMESFEVGILKGEPHGGNMNVKGIVHRSPEISSTGANRIILRIDI
ncbi:MAG: DUF1826 domain-containing protein [Cytophagales bacterium]|nr:DUF1826 domain-containing protein [Cytophagales bacterium]